MSLPLPVIDRLFDRLTATYGHDFMRRWEGLNIAAVKSSWGHELAGFANNLQAIAWALENLPERAPNVIEFRNLARKSPSSDVPMLTPPKVNVELANKVINELKAKPIEKIDHKAWAKAIMARDQAGEKLNPTTLLFAKQALGLAA